MAELVLQPSLILKYAAGAVLTGTLLALVITPTPLWLVLPVAVLSGLQCCDLLSRLWRKSRQRTAVVQRFRLEANACCVGSISNWRRYHVPRIRYCGEWLLILELTPVVDSSASSMLAATNMLLHRRCLLLTIDSLSAADHWRLRYYLQNVIRCTNGGKRTS